MVTSDKVIASTLSAREESELQQHLGRYTARLDSGTREVDLGSEPYEVAEVSLHADPHMPVQLLRADSVAASHELLGKLDRTILALGISALVFATLVLSFVAGTITSLWITFWPPCAPSPAAITPTRSRRVAAPKSWNWGLLSQDARRPACSPTPTDRNRANRGLGKGCQLDFARPAPFLGRVVANAEFLYEADQLKLGRDEIFQEIKIASEQMTELLDSLRELAREHRTLSLVTASLESVARSAVDSVLARPEFRKRSISIQAPADTTGVFDSRKIERALFNLLLNACEATSERGRIEIEIGNSGSSFEVRIADDGIGVPPGIRGTLFDPFISAGKSNGTGLGLAIVSKIIHDHYGSISVERTSESGTVFLIKFPRTQTGSLDAIAREVHEPNRSLAD